MQGAKLVAVGVPQVGQIHLPHRAIAHPWRVFARGAAVGYAGRMKSIGLLGRRHRKADGAAVAMACRFAIDGLGNAKAAGGSRGVGAKT